MRQYLDVKARYPDAIVFFRLGDFYEMFFEDAVYAARALDLTLTTRDKGKEDPVPMCGVPHHAARAVPGQADRARPQGRAVRAARGPASVARGIVKREVVRVVTPGVILDEESLDPRAPSYVAAVAGDARGAATAWRSSTSRPATSAPPRRRPPTRWSTSSARVAPRELVLGRGDDDGRRWPTLVRARATRAVPQARRSPTGDGARADAGARRSGAAFDAGAAPSGRRAPRRPPARVLRYARATQPGATLPVARLEVYRRADYAGPRRAGARATSS